MHCPMFVPSSLPLCSAALRGDAELVKTLINTQRHSASERGVSGWTPLHFAARYGAEDVVRLLLTNGVDAEVEAKTVNQDTPLHLAAEAGHDKVVRLLLEAKANPHAQDSRNRTPEARCKSAEVQGLLAAHSKSKGPGPEQGLSVPALQAALNEATNKLQQLTARNSVLEQHAATAGKEAAAMLQDMADKAPLKALLLTCATLTCHY
jgi:ankyrin repeat protein